MLFLFSTHGFSQFQVEKTESRAVHTPSSVFLTDKKEGDWLRWDDGINATAVGLTGPGWWTGAIHFAPEDLSIFDGHVVGEVSVYQQDPTMDGEPIIKIWQGPDINNLTEVVSQKFEDKLNDWHEIELEDPFSIDASQWLVFGVEWNDVGDGFFPHGGDADNDHPYKGDAVILGTYPADPWEYLHYYGISLDWNMVLYTWGCTPYTVTFEVTDANTGDDIDDAVITFDGITYEPGEYVIESYAGIYYYLVEREGYETYEDEVEVFDNIIVEVELMPLECVPVTFTVFCDHTGDPVAGANVNFDGEDYTTNVNGVAVVDGVLPGLYEYEITRDGYEPCYGDVEVEEDPIEIDINLIPIFYDLTLHAEPGDGGVVDGAGEYVVDQEVEITAEANEGWYFIEWTGDIEHITDPASAETIVTMPAADVDLTAHFVPTYTLTLAANPEEGGEVEGEGDYAEGKEVHVIATPAENWMFVNWTDEAGEVKSDEAEFHYTMPAADVTLTANFEYDPPLFALTLNVDPAGSGTVDGAGKYPEGETVIITATPDDDWLFAEWTGDLEHVGEPANATTNVIMPAANIALTAKFEEKVSTGKITEAEIKVFPNPARNKFYVESNKMIKEIRLINISGQVITDIMVDKLSTEINVSNVRPGVYFMQIHTSERVITERVQIVR